MLLFITIFFFMFDLIWSFLGPASPEQNISTFSRNLAFPLKVMLPKIVPGVATKCAEMGIGDVILPGLCYKLMKVFEREHAQNSALSLSVLIGYFFGLSCCIFSMIFWNQVQPVNLFVIPFVLIGILGAATGSGNIMTLAKFS